MAALASTHAGQKGGGQTAAIGGSTVMARRTGLATLLMAPLAALVGSQSCVDPSDRRLDFTRLIQPGGNSVDTPLGPVHRPGYAPPGLCSVGQEERMAAN